MHLVWPLSVVVIVSGVGGLILARRATRRLAEAGDKRGLGLATLGAWIGWGNVALTATGFFLALFQSALNNVFP